MTRREPPTVTPFIDYRTAWRRRLRYPLVAVDGTPGDLGQAYQLLTHAGFDVTAVSEYGYISDLTWEAGGVEQHLNIGDYLDRIDVHGRIIR